MTTKNDWPVVAGDVRPARPDGTCCYCCAPLGNQHRDGCVTRTRTVVVEVTFRYVKTVPEDWDGDMIEFHMNESSSCADSLASEVSALANADGRCLCGQTVGKFIREATPEDEEALGYTLPEQAA